MRALTLMGVVGVALLMSMQPALAVHGSPYKAYGPAIKGTDQFNAEVDWVWGTFTVTISDLSGNRIVGPVTFYGGETETGRGYGGTEVFLYHGWANNPAISFDIKGFQQIDIATAKQKMLYVGNYADYQLALIVDG